MDRHQFRLTVDLRRLLASIVLGCGLAAAAGAAQSDQVAANKEIVSRYLEAAGTPRFATVRKSLEAIGHQQLRFEFHNLKYNADGSELLRRAQPDFKAVPDRVNTITGILGEGDMVGATVRVTGTHKGNLFGIAATGRSFKIDEVAIFRLVNGKIAESWLMADEAGLLGQIGSRLPTRNDGRLIAPPVLDDTRDADVVLNELLSHPVDSPAYRNKVLVVAYKAKTKPPGYEFGSNRPYDELLRPGNFNMVNRVAGINATGSFLAAWSGRQDQIGVVIAEGDRVMMQFRMNALNTGPLYTLPPSYRQIRSWEVGIASFAGDKWQTGWWFGDELGMLLQMGGQAPQEFMFGSAPGRGLHE